MGTMPSSRLTRLLQEKAEALRKRRQIAEAATEQSEGRLRLLAEVGVELPETAARQERIRDWQRKSDWEASDVEAQSLTQYIDATAPEAVSVRRHELLDRVESLRAAGSAVPPELDELLSEVRELTFRTDLLTEITTLARFATLVRGVQEGLANGARRQVMAVARWVGVPADEAAEIDRRISEILPAPDAGPSADWVDRLQAAIPELIPAAVARRERSRAEAEAVVTLGRDIGLAVVELEEALAADARAAPSQWGETVPSVEQATSRVRSELRGRVSQVLGYLTTTLDSLPEHGADPGDAVAEIARIQAQVETAGVMELGPLLQRARETAEEPIVSVVAGLLDEVRPKLVEARELGRDPSEVFASMNRAREALRLKIYGEALAASVEAIDRVSQLTSDLDAAREEAEALGRLLGRLETLKVSVVPFRAALAEVTAQLDHFTIDRARATLRDTVRALGRETARYFGAEIQRLTAAADTARQRGFLPEGVPDDLEKAQHHIDAGALPEAGEAIAQVDVRLRTAAGPYISRRVEEMRRGFEEIRDPDLSISTLRSLADSDIALRVKEDLTQSLESLRQAEREFSAAFAVESSSLLEALEERQRVLEEMGGAGSEFLRQTDEIQQIFDMGDFVKCALAAREFLTSTEEVQKSRAEEGISHAKLDLVEIDQFGLAKAELTKQFESAQQDLAAGRLVEAYRGGLSVHSGAEKVLGGARPAAALLTQSKERLLQIEQSGTDTGGFQDEVTAAEAAFRSLDFEGVRAHLGRLQERLDRAAQAEEVRRILGESDQLAADATRLGIAVEGIEAKLTEARGSLGAAGGLEARALAYEAHQALVQTLRPVLEENLKSVEQDFEIARRLGVDMGPLSGLLSDARGRLFLPVPLGAADLIENARGQLSQTRGLVEHAERSAKRVEEAFGQAELLRLATPAMRTRVETLEHQLSERQFARTVETAGPLEQEILQTTTLHLTRTIAGLQGLVVRARQEGIPTAAAEHLLAKAREALQEGRPMDALQLAAQSEGEIERVGLQTRVARGALEALDAMRARLDAEGIRFPQGPSITAEARSSFDRREYARVLELSLEASELLTQTRELYRKAHDALTVASGTVQEALTMGAEPAEVNAMLGRARELSEAGDYSGAAARAREAIDLSSWAIERRYSGTITEVRGLLQATRSEGSPEAEGVANLLKETEAFLQAKQWAKAGERLARAQAKAFQVLDRVVASRIDRIGQRDAHLEPAGPAETERRRAWRAEVDEARARGAVPEVMASIDQEEERAQDSLRAGLERRVSELKDRLWVGERLGLDATPAMEHFSEARMALDQGRFDVVDREVVQGNSALEGLIREGISRRAKQIETELLYARDGLRVRIGDMDQRLSSVDLIAREGRLVEAGRTLLAVEEDLNQRKSLHRQLMNLHYLIEAALRRASEARLDAGDARRLFEASVRESATSYAEAIVKARASLKLVDGLLKASEPPTAFWPFKRPAPDPAERRGQ
ncbi:MAG: hypothetical protein L3J95_03455 [Thermoplasmata archaeon]|nr:hypothetical protein [Thermoplasmata archaeon]MCI4359463.1 hypothetical protein [Thermoplasmata archaeon]